ncbi:ribonucleases P/MRP protein subunit POP1-domain-containing protein [Lasiosphaeria hispida]|uniref:Ribonucleases P/MRP protein subunit POP1-domain-containing protein n=1 Tax=Lasiosphaeria hispida TaxID=260671 RepID=A0AAJ0HVF8_9PEZI|nr:ribonucleases P/MRP protein subunit POP1-domain-containing protein [Lasiosphaeria hispida]
MDRRKSFPAGKAPDAKRKEPPPAANNSKNQAHDTRPNSHALKRVKFNDARNIRSQPPDAALEDGRLDLQKFLSAREYEIKALETSMRKCKASNATRVFQQVPRAMRRRTASHNVKRVPKRLRERAKREQIGDNTPTVEARKRRPRTTRARIRAETAKKLDILAARKRKRRLEKPAVGGAMVKGKEGDAKPTVQSRAPRPKIRRNTLNEPPKIKSKFRKRQLNKTWLPTHLWHAKRATMAEPSKPIWRFAIPITSTEKCYRPTHRASGQKGAVAWDMSYMSTIGLYGSSLGVERVLRALGLTQEGLWAARGQKWRGGSRKWSGLLSKDRKESRRIIGPATIIWNPEPAAETAQELGDPKRSQRELLIRTHPSCFLELFNELLKLVKMQSPQLHIEDLRFEIGSIELTGPGSTEALLGILKPYDDKPGAEYQADIFESLAGVTNPASLPKDAFLAFSARDPRLAYPPKQVNVPDRTTDPALLETLTKWPVEKNLAPFGLFSRDTRHRASQLPSQKSINRRKGSSLPGKEVLVTAADPPIPVILLASRSSTAVQAQGTWTLMAPWKCILPIWYSLMHYPLSTGGNPRLGGLDEQRQIAFEQNVPWFPGDFPGTDAGLSWELDQQIKRKRDWDRRPKGKRVEWKSLDLGAGRKGEIGDGLACDFEHLFGLPKNNISGLNNTQNPAISDDPNAMELDHLDKPQGAQASEDSPNPMAVIKQMTKASFGALVASPTNEKAPNSSIVTVTLTFTGRGVASPCARIYRLPPQKSPMPVLPSTQAEVPATEPPPSTIFGLPPSDLREQWLGKLPAKSTSSLGGKGRQAKKQTSAPPRMPPGADLKTRKRLLAASLLTAEPQFPKSSTNQTDVGRHPLCPGEEELIGFVTAGAFSLSEGKGTAIGSLSAEKVLETVRETGAREGHLCVVRNAGETVGWLARWEVV